MTKKQRIEIGRRIRAIREALGWSQESVAEAAGISRSALLRIERGQADPQWSTLQRIADALGVTMAELVGEE